MAKVLVSIDDRLLARIDRAAASAGVSRSAYLSRIAERELDVAGGPGQTRAARAALRRLDALFGSQPVAEDATAAVRAERDAR